MSRRRPQPRRARRPAAREAVLLAWIHSVGGSVSVARAARETGLDVRTVNEAAAILASRGLVSTRRFGFIELDPETAKKLDGSAAEIAEELVEA